MNENYWNLAAVLIKCNSNSFHSTSHNINQTINGWILNGPVDVLMDGYTVLIDVSMDVLMNVLMNVLMDVLLDGCAVLVDVPMMY